MVDAGRFPTLVAIEAVTSNEENHGYAEMVSKNQLSVINYVIIDEKLEEAHFGP